MTRKITCNDGCCIIELKDIPCQVIHTKHYDNRNYIKKAGVFIYDPDENRVVLVQSRGQWWGLPKGSIENETIPECAVREVKEETGIELKVDSFLRATNVKNVAIYYYTEMKTTPINIPDFYQDNDATGLSWIKIDCLAKLLNEGRIAINSHTRETFKKFLNITLPKLDFVKSYS